jgi:membrane protein implicated in regulation of membrane protease activity
MSVYDSVLFLITHVEPWWLVFFASLLLVISLTVFDSEFLLTISGGILLWTLLLFLRFPAEAALIGLPICFFISYFLQTRFYGSISGGDIPFERAQSDFVGTIGILRVAVDDNSASSYYDKKYKSDISQESVPDNFETKTFRVVLDDGSTHDASPDFEGGKSGDKVKVSGFNNGQALVSRI